MTDQTTENFWEAFEQWTPPELPPQPIRRLYYDNQGTPLFYSSEDLPGNYIDVDFVTFESLSLQNLMVVNGQLTRRPLPATIAKLVPSTQGTPCSPYNVAIVVGLEQPHQLWELRRYAKN